MQIAFISDLHLSEHTTSNNQMFYTLMAKWQNELDVLYILGDFFDFWCGDDDDNQFIRDIKSCLKQFTQHKPIYFIWGNHDFGVGNVFAKATGITLIKDCSILKIGQYNILLSHGDAFCTLDIAHQKLKRIIQNPIIKWLLRKTPLSWRYKIKEKLEHKSSQVFNSKPQEIYNVVDKTIVKFATKKKTNVVIHGHTHNPGCYNITTNDGTITRFEIPDWADRPPGGYILLKNDVIQIIYDNVNKP